MPVNDALASEQWVRFQYCRDRGHLEFINKADRCDKYFAGEQWLQADLNALTLAKRPALTINKILSTLSTLFGEQIFNRNETVFRPAKNGTSEIADSLTAVWQELGQRNQLPWVRSELFADGTIRSRGFLDVRLDFADSMIGNIVIENVNSKNVVVDPDAEEYDPDKWNDVFVTKWLTPQDIAILYNDADADYLKIKDGSSFPYGYDSIERVRDRFGGALPLAGYYGVIEPYGLRRNVRVLDRQYRRLDKQLHFVDIQTGDTRQIPAEWDRNRIAAVVEKAQGQINTIKKQVKRIRWTVTADNVVLHDDWSPYKHFTVVPYFPYFRYGRTIGLVENLLGPQDLLNKTSSQELHVINTTANSGWKMKYGSLKNMSIEELEQKGASTGLVLELEETADAEKIQPNPTPQGLDRMSYKAEEHIKSISNVSDSMQGNDREDVAAKAIDLKQKRGQVNHSKPLDNLARTDFLLARNVLDIVQEYYSEERIIHITTGGPAQEPKEVPVNTPDPVTGEILNDLTLGEYSILISSAPSSASLEDTQFDQAKGLKEMGIAIPDHVLIENSRLQRKAEITKEIEESANSPEAQQKAQLQMRLLEAQVSKEEAEANQKTADANLKRAKAEKELAAIQQADAKIDIEKGFLAVEAHNVSQATTPTSDPLAEAKQVQDIQHADEAHQQKLALNLNDDARKTDMHSFKKQQAEEQALQARADQINSQPEEGAAQ